MRSANRCGHSLKCETTGGKIYLKDASDLSVPTARGGGEKNNTGLGMKARKNYMSFQKHTRPRAREEDVIANGSP